MAGLGRFECLEAFESSVLELSRGILGQEHPKTLAAMSALAIKYRVMGRFGDAELLQSRAMNMYAKTLGEGHPDPITVGVNRAIVWAYRERYNAAAS